MARNFFSLAAPNPGNQQIDFSPVGNALEAYGRQKNYQGEVARQKEQQQYQRGRDQMQDQRVAKADKMSLEESLAKRAAAIGMLPPEQRGQAWKQHVSTHLKYFPDNQLDPEDLDPMTGPERYAAAFGGIAKDPMDAKIKEADLAYKQASTAKIYADAKTGKAPDLKEMYDDQGRKQKVMWDGSKYVPVGGAEVPEPKDPKEYQTKDAMLAERMQRTNAIIENLMTKQNARGGKVFDPTNTRNNWAPDDGVIASMVNSNEWKQYQQSAREGIAAILRKDTGAAVTESEWNLYFPMLYPQPGDDAPTVQQKANARAAAAQALQSSSGPAYARMFPNGPIGVTPATASPTAPQGPPAAAVEALRANPDRAGDFDAKYGPGSAARILGGR